jgi:hypothetical protein
VYTVEFDGGDVVKLGESEARPMVLPRASDHASQMERSIRKSRSKLESLQRQEWAAHAKRTGRHKELLGQDGKVMKGRWPHHAEDAYQAWRKRERAVAGTAATGRAPASPREELQAAYRSRPTSPALEAARLSLESLEARAYERYSPAATRARQAHFKGQGSARRHVSTDNLAFGSASGRYDSFGSHIQPVDHSAAPLVPAHGVGASRAARRAASGPMEAERFGRVPPHRQKPSARTDDASVPRRTAAQQEKFVASPRPWGLNAKKKNEHGILGRRDERERIRHFGARSPTGRGEDSHDPFDPRTRAVLAERDHSGRLIPRAPKCAILSSRQRANLPKR